MSPQSSVFRPLFQRTQGLCCLCTSYHRICIRLRLPSKRTLRPPHHIYCASLCFVCRADTKASRPVSQTVLQTTSPGSTLATPLEQAADNSAIDSPVLVESSLANSTDQKAAEVQPPVSTHSSRAQSSELSVQALQVSLCAASFCPQVHFVMRLISGSST